MHIADVVEVLDALDSAGVRHWVGGGWGVDALAGRETREHRDLDLAVDAAHFDVCMDVLAALGYQLETDWLPLRVEVAAPGRRWVDVHPVAFDSTGHGLQGEADDVHFHYPPEAFGSGQIGERSIPCLSVSQQRAFHSGYEHRPQDEHDLEILDTVAEELSLTSSERVPAARAVGAEDPASTDEVHLVWRGALSFPAGVAILGSAPFAAPWLYLAAVVLHARVVLTRTELTWRLPWRRRRVLLADVGDILIAPFHVARRSVDQATSATTQEGSCNGSEHRATLIERTSALSWTRPASQSDAVT